MIFIICDNNVTVVLTICELTSSRVKLHKKKTSIHCVMKPSGMQLERPYNSSKVMKEKSIPVCLVVVFCKFLRCDIVK